MQTLLNPSHFFTFPNLPTSRNSNSLHSSFQWRPLLCPPLTLPGNFSVKCFSSDEFPVDESFLEKFGPKDEETEDEARKRNWVERGWAPWEEVFTPEADFARKSLNEGEEVPLQTPEAIEAFKMLSPKYRKQKMEEMGLTEDDYYRKQCEIKGEIPEPLETTWTRPLVLQVVPPRDWPPRGWDVDREELEFIRGAHKLQAMRVDLDRLEKDVRTDTENLCLDRYKVFLKQYKEWVAANKDRLEEESYKYDQDYHPGRRKRGKDYKEGMYELPFYYPGQICEGKVTTLHLYQGAFVDIGGVYDGWVPIKGNDWYWIRHHIKVGMPVIVEILAKRDPYRFRFPIEMRFVHPNIDHLIFNRFDYPPIFHRDEDDNPDEVRRDCGRPPIPRKDPGIKPEDESLLSNHPYVEKLWQIHVAEQMILDDFEMNPDKYGDKKLSELSDEEDFDEENNIEYTKVRYKNSLLPKKILKTSVKELDLGAALSERQFHNKLRQEAQKRGEEYKIEKLRRNLEMDEYDLMHWRRSFEEREALIRDISCRQALGLPLEEPGRYVDASYFGRDQYDPSNPLYRYDYWGEPKNSEKSKQERMTDAHNKSIVGKGVVWYEMSYEDAIKAQMEREASPKIAEEDDTDEEDDDDDDFDFSILQDSVDDFPTQPHVNGTESSRISDEGMFED
ncbi:protein PLASTID TRANSCRIPTIONALLY ACTIVE 10 isoform X1 [Cucumis melo var. makuwa]|uniref:Protein PLASTID TRANSCRIPTIONALLY ACTIVE 10 isoform X1 n=2 Tax=Cucumis melo TaxID=3656 RepID=A0A5D3BH68_CUCMM|nr:protein PLASTID TRANSCRIPTIONALLY ACTIVE 10 isoform X1 [Cucumis melo]KAA0057783.1 protein PLASTID TRANSCRIPTIONALLY ACTIVE 10 isoform X1 [Cucumis melo var. makuwa]TYJ98467.1 protein PLASTID TRANSCRIPTIONALLY ACTIVE 10 isoform X1 [Cucumis melo var. makuwa]